MNYTIDLIPNGFGCLYQTKICALAYCRLHSLNYRHTNFKSIHHWLNVKECNNFIGFDKYIKADDETIKLDYNIKLYDPDPDINFNENIMKEIRENYYTNIKPIVPYTNFLAIHIRRGDINIEFFRDRWNSDEYYSDLIRKLIVLYPDKKLVVFSQGSLNDFKYLTDEFDIIIDLNKNDLNTFHYMVKADILVIARSSFSYVAALLNENIIHADVLKNRVWHHRPKKDWVII